MNENDVYKEILAMSKFEPNKKNTAIKNDDSPNAKIARYEKMQDYLKKKSHDINFKVMQNGLAVSNGDGYSFSIDGYNLNNPTEVPNGATATIPFFGGGLAAKYRQSEGYRMPNEYAGIQFNRKF